MERERTGFLQQIILLVLASAIAGFLGTVVGVEVVKEKVVNISSRLDKLELRMDKFEALSQTILEAQVKSLTHQLEEKDK